MKKLYTTIAAMLFILTALAQPTPTTFLDVQIAGSKESVIEQLVEAGFEVMYKNSMVKGMYKGDEVKVTIYGWNDDLKQVSGLSVITMEKFESEEAVKRFNKTVSDYEKDPPIYC